MSVSASPALPPVAPVPPQSAGQGRRQWFLWLRLLVLTAMGGGLALPFLFVQISRLTAREATRTASQFLMHLQNGDTDALLPLLAPKGGGVTEASADEDSPKDRDQVRAYVELLAPKLEGHEFVLQPPTPTGESLHIFFMARRGGGAFSPLPSASKSGPENLAPPPAPNPASPPREQWEGSIHLRQVNGRWRVVRLTLPANAGTGPGMPSPSNTQFDFESPLPTPPANPLSDFKRLAPITGDEFAAAWQIDLDA